MKKIILILLLIVIEINAKSCMTDIYFGNGVWNTQQEAIYNKNELRQYMLVEAPTRLDIQKEGSEYTFKYAYNPSYGKIDDLIETFWQLKESGQISEGYFGAVYAALTWEEDTEFYNKLSDVIRNYRSDANKMFTLYQQSSFNQKHNVLLVAHSQGNLFGNKMYTLMSDKEKAKFRMVSVATPANHVMKPDQTSPYVTATGDYVIGPIPGSLPGNVDGSGHTFIGTYLNGSINAPRKIALYVKNAYDDLARNASCTKYAMIFMDLHSEGKMFVYGNPVGTNIYEDITTVNMPVRPSTQLYDQDGRPAGYTCGGGEFVWGDYRYFTSTNDPNIVSWLPGTLSSKEMVESRKNINIVVFSPNFQQCITIDNSKELYNVAIEAFE
jgi:hypothetical protein